MSDAATVAIHATPEQLTDDDRNLLISVVRRFERCGAAPLFTTATPDLWDRFIASIPQALRRIYACSACRKFVGRFGGLVTIDGDGIRHSAMWDDAPGIFSDAVRGLADHVERARITGVFLSKEVTWGTPVTGPWNHLAVTPPTAIVWTDRVKTAGQRVAELHEDYGILRRSLAEYPVEILRNAHNLLTTGQLYRSEKCIGVAEWLLSIHEQLDARKDRLRNEATAWLAVATAPPGFCHVRTTVISTLLDDIIAGHEFRAIKRSFDAKMTPTQYQRPQTAPTSGNIAQAEKIVEQLGIGPSLARRFARVEEVDALWRPIPIERKESSDRSVFGHLKPGGIGVPADQVEAPATMMTWTKFAATILPSANKIEFAVPRHGAFIAIVTAANLDAPPILRWDSEGQRNPFSWYLYASGSSASQWNLRGGAFCEIAAVTLLPSRWYGTAKHSHQGEGVILVLSGARDLNAERAGAALFPETLRSDLHAVHATIEAYSRSAKLSGVEEATACGFDLRSGNTWHVTLRVTTKYGRASYMLDRWD